MTPREFYEWLKDEQQPSDINLPVPLRLGNSDVMAARLLLWLFEEMPEDATQGDLDDVLDAAKWWSIFWAAAFKANTDCSLTSDCRPTANSAAEPQVKRRNGLHVPR